MARLEHPHILLIYAYGERDGLAYLVMPTSTGARCKIVCCVPHGPATRVFEAICASSSRCARARLRP